MIHLVSILQNLMCLKIVEYKILVIVLDKSKGFYNFEAKTSFLFFLYGKVIVSMVTNREIYEGFSKRIANFYLETSNFKLA